MSLAVANQYAKALLEAVSAAGSATAPEQALQEIDVFGALLTESAELKTILLSPAVSHTAKEKAINRLAGLAGIGGLVCNFISVVIRHRRLAMMGDMRERFRALLDERMGLVRAQVTSSAALAASEMESLEAALRQSTGKEVRGVYNVDASLLGGVSVRLGSKLMDGSVRGRLDEMRRQIRAGE